MSLKLKLFLFCIIVQFCNNTLLQKEHEHFTLSNLVKTNAIKKLHRGRMLAVGSYSSMKKQIERNLFLDNNENFRASQIKNSRILYPSNKKRRLTYIF